MSYQIIDSGYSRSFPEIHALHTGTSPKADTLIVLGDHAGRELRSISTADKAAVVVELGTECLGVYTGESQSQSEEGSNVLGFSRFRLGEGEPSDLVELVRQPNTTETAITAARDAFESAGLEVAVCLDFAGRIIDRLVRPYYNEALRRLDEGLASAADMDLTLKLGLGYPEGPIELLERTGLAHHHDVTLELFKTYGEKAYAPARRARVAKQRQEIED